MAECVKRAIGSRQLLRRGESVLVAVSGGVDSMVLLHLLEGWAAVEGWKLTVAHFNHGLRGRSSDADERLVRRVAGKLGLAVRFETGPVGETARREGISIEMAARRLRHAFLAQAAAAVGAGTIALAHHADDQVELFFLRLLRGSGAEGLGGMRWESPSPADPRIRLIRPLLDQTKAALRQLAATAKIVFREDASNARDDALRNRLRNQLLPLLRAEYQPALDSVILREMDILREESFVLDSIAQREFAKSPAGGEFARLPTAIQRRNLQRQLLELGIIPSFDLIESLRQSEGTPISHAPGLTVQRDGAGRLLREMPGTHDFSSTSARLHLTAESGVLTFEGVEVRWNQVAQPGIALPSRDPGVNCEWFDAEQVGTEIVLRHWQPGDRFQPLGMPAPVKLQDLFVNQKVLRNLRHRLVVGVTRTGQLFWVEGLRMAEGCKLTPGTRRRLQWQWKRL